MGLKGGGGGGKQGIIYAGKISSFQSYLSRLAMNNYPDVIHADEAHRLIKKLIKILGKRNIDSSVEKYNKSLKHAGYFYKELYLKRKYHLFELFNYLFDLERKGKSIKKHVGDYEISELASSAKTITTLLRIMPECVKGKYIKDLTDKDRWADFLFEIDSAWGFYKRNGEIEWHKEDNSPDFIVKFPEIEFDVECKRITVDAARKVHQKDFYCLSDKLLPKIAGNYKGSITIELDGRLSSNDQELGEISCQIEELISDNKTGYCEISRSVKVVIDLQSADEKGFDHEMLSEIKKHTDLNTFYAVFAKNKVNPICLAIRSTKRDDVLEYIKGRMKDATKKQLKPNRPGLLYFFLEDIFEYHLDGLKDESGISYLSEYLFARNDDFLSVIGIIFCSEQNFEHIAIGNHITSKVLFFHNPNCKYKSQSQRIYSFFYNDKR